MHSSTLPPKPPSLPGRGSVWQHYKGTFYRVIEVSRHSEDPAMWLVTYAPVDGGDAWTRTMRAPLVNLWPGFLDFRPGAPGHRFRHVSGPRTWRDEVPESEAADARLSAAAPLMLAALKAYRDQYAGRETWPDDEVACLDLADAAIAAAAPAPAERTTIAVTWRDENYGDVSDVVAFRVYGLVGLPEPTRRRVDRTIRDAGFSFNARRATWMAMVDTKHDRKAGLTMALEAAGFQVEHKGAIPADG